ncbi:MAG: vWA domain-containing protein [Marmoricola sp.]
MALLDRHLAFLEALRDAGLPASAAEGLDAVRAVDTLGLGDREGLRVAYAATLVKRHAHRPAFDRVFDLFFPALVGEGVSTALDRPGGLDQRGGLDRPAGAGELGDGPADLATYREQLTEALALGDPDLLAAMAREGVQRFGAIRGRGPGDQRWSSYNVMNRVSPGELVDRVLEGLGLDLDDDATDDLRRDVESQVSAYEQLVQADVARRAAEVRGAEYVARHTVRPSIDQLDFTAARTADLAEMRREIYPLALRLATRVGRRHHHRRGDALDFRRTVRASMSTGGVPMTTHHRPRRPSRTDLVVLCDVSGSVASFASFTLMLVYALREQFSRVRAFTFVDEIHEVTDRFSVAADPAETLTELAASAQYASLWGRTSYGRAFTRFEERYADALTPRTNLLILGDARSNYSDLALPVLRRMTYDARHSWWLNPEHRRHWGTGDSAAREYGALVPMVECRNLTQLGEFVESLA